MIRATLGLLALLVAGAIAEQAPQRDRLVMPTGTGVLTGFVTSGADSPQPLPGAVITVSAPELPRSRATLADANGHFAFENLPPGRFMLSASKRAYITMAYGATRPGRPGVAVTLAAAERRDQLTIRLPRGAVITGAVLDASGQPQADMQVSAFRTDDATPRGIDAAFTAASDDRGVYRIFGLPPGAYYVRTSPGIARAAVQRLSESDVDAALARVAARAPAPAVSAPARSDERRLQSFAAAPIFYPGTPVLANATPVVVAAGEVRDGVNLSADLVPTISIEGVVTNPFGPLPGIQLILTLPLGTSMTSGAVPALTQRPGVDGVFRYSGVVPGDYTIIARTTAAQTVPAGSMAGGGARGGGMQAPVPPDVAGRLLWAMAEVTAARDDISGVALVLQPALRLLGRVAFDGDAPRPDPASLRISLTPVDNRGGGAIGSTNFGSVNVPPATARADGTFEVAGVLPGRYRIAVTGVDQSVWWLRALAANGRDLLDEAIEFGRAGDIANAVLTFSSRRTVLAGQVTGATGDAAADHVVVLFPKNPSLWGSERRVRFTRPASDGRFEFRDLPAGDYLMAALTDLEPSDLRSVAFLDQLVAASIGLAIGEGASVRQDIRIGGRDPILPPPLLR